MHQYKEANMNKSKVYLRKIPIVSLQRLTWVQEFSRSKDLKAQAKEHKEIETWGVLNGNLNNEQRILTPLNLVDWKQRQG